MSAGTYAAQNPPNKGVFHRLLAQFKHTVRGPYGKEIRRNFAVK